MPPATSSRAGPALTRTRASTATQPSGRAITGLRSSSATSGSSSRGGRGGGAGRRARRRRPRGCRGSRATSRRPCRRDELLARRRRSAARCRKPASPISSARTPPGPNATSGPKTGSWTTPASSSTPPCDHRLDDERRADPLGRLAHRVLVAEVERDAARLRLVRAGGRRLDDDREAELRAPRRPPRRRVAASALRDERDAVGLEQRARLRRVEPASPLRRVVDDVAGGLAIDAVEVGHRARPGGAASRRARRRARARGRRTPGRRTPRRRDSRSAHAGVPSALMTTASTGLSPRRARPRARSRRRPRRRAGDDRRHEEDDHRVDARVGEQQRERLLVGRGRSPSRAGRPGSRRSPRREGRRERGDASRRRASGSSSPAASQASAQRMPSPPALVRTATRRPRGSGWLERSAATSTSSSSVRARMTPAWRKSASTAASEPASAAVCELAARAPAAVVPAFSARIGLLRATRRGEAAELARVAERLEVEQDEVGRGVVLPPLEQVVRGDVGLVADRDERREAESRADACSSSASPSAPLCDEKPIAPGGSARGAKVAFSAAPTTAMPRQFGPTQPRAVGADEREQPLLPLASLRADLGEAGGDDAERAHALRSASSAASSTRAAGNADDGEVDRRPGSRRSSRSRGRRRPARRRG